MACPAAAALPPVAAAALLLVAVRAGIVLVLVGLVGPPVELWNIRCGSEQYSSSAAVVDVVVVLLL